MRARTAKIVSGLGKTLIGAGLLVLLFAMFQLWGTSLAESSAQNELQTTFEEKLVAVTQELDETDTSELRELPEDEIPESGDPIAIIEIESIDVKKTVVEGVTRDVLRSGPGRYPETSFPGQPGNAAIAGHRTTYGSPFFDLDKLQPGELIKVTTLQGEFFYEVDAHEVDGQELGYQIVAPSAGEVLEDRPGLDTLTLTACHPKYSAAQRLVVTATLTGPPAPETVFEVERTEVLLDPSDALAESLNWQPDEIVPTIVWALITAALGFAIAFVAKRWRKLPTYIIGAAPFTIVLFLFFTQLEKLLPAV